VSPLGATRESRTRGADMVLAALVLAIVGMMIVPLPTPVIDGLIAVNLTLGVLLLATALYMRDALSFASFPTLILIATLYRLALNVSSTRLILLQADAGRIIDAFGNFVVRGDYAVGAMVFAVITLIQFLVIARGAERVAEVGARFSLDAMPGKQMAIDAELRAGTVSPDAARSARKRLERESQLYGAMDGAMKFVKGDAIAGLVITLVNFGGGVILGATTRGLDVTTSLKTYGLLTIGDGLVTQIPSLLGSTAAALAVTRVASDHSHGSLATDIADQLFGDARVLFVGALVLGVLALVPAMPGWPFAGMAALCVWLGLRAQAKRARAVDAQAVVYAKITLALSPTLSGELLVRGLPRPELAKALRDAELHARQGLGLSLPSVAIVESKELSARSHQLRFRGLPDAPHEHDTLAPAVICERIAQDLTLSARRHVEVCLAVSDVQHMLEGLDRDEPGLVRKLSTLGITPQVLTQVLRQLVREGVSIACLPEILEALDAPAAPRTNERSQLTEHVRRALARRIAHGLAPAGSLHVLRLDPMLEETLLDALTRDENDEWLALPPSLAREIEGAVVRAIAGVPEPRALVTSVALRRHLRSLLDSRLPDLSVLSALELSPGVTLASSHIISP